MSAEPLRDARGVAVAPLGPGPARLVSLVPSTTETLFALGRGGDVVGATRFCVHPRGAIGPEKWIGGTKNPKINKIIQLAPDLVLANREENRREDIEALEAAGLRVWVAEPRTVPEARDDLLATARLVGRAERGAELATALDAAMAALDPRADGPTVAYLIWREPWMVAGRETFIADLLARAGARVPFEGRYPEVTLDDLRAVDRVLLASEPFPFDESHRAALLAGGFRPEQVTLVDGELLSWHGVRLIEGLRYAARLFDRAR